MIVVVVVDTVAFLLMLLMLDVVSDVVDAVVIVVVNDIVDVRTLFTSAPWRASAVAKDCHIVNHTFLMSWLLMLFLPYCRCVVCCSCCSLLVFDVVHFAVFCWLRCGWHPSTAQHLMLMASQLALDFHWALTFTFTCSSPPPHQHRHHSQPQQ